MFTVKLFRGGDKTWPHSEIITQANTVEIRCNVQPDSSILRGKHIVVDGGMSTEWHYYVDWAEKSPEQYDWAVIENAAGKTTEIVRP